MLLGNCWFGKSRARVDARYCTRTENATNRQQSRNELECHIQHERGIDNDYICRHYACVCRH